MKSLPFLLGAALIGVAQAQTLQPAPSRITDTAIQADHQTYETAQNRLKAINATGRPLRDYHLSKAQCWLDVSVHEYTRNDRSAFPQLALDESSKLASGMEKGERLGFETPLVNGAARLRDDLWARAIKLQSHAGFKCAQQRVACAEVELVHAGNEINQQGWRHAQPYVQIAEDQLAEADALAAACIPPPAPPPVMVAPVVVPPAPPPIRIESISVSVVFNFDRFEEGQIRPWSIVQLEDLLARAKREGLELTAVRLVGHADRLNGTGKADYNERLSEKRVKTVAAILRRQGLADSLVSTGYRGDQLQVQGCEGRFKAKADLEECLLPNRRVEVVLEGRRR